MLSYLFESVIKVDETIINTLAEQLSPYIQSFIIVKTKSDKHPFDISVSDVGKLYMKMKRPVAFKPTVMHNHMFDKDHEFQMAIYNGGGDSYGSITQDFKYLTVNFAALWNGEFGSVDTELVKNNVEYIQIVYDAFMKEIKNTLEHELTHILEQPKNLPLPDSKSEYDDNYQTSAIEFSPLLITNIRQMEVYFKRMKDEMDYNLSDDEKKEVLKKITGSELVGHNHITDFVIPKKFFTELKEKNPSQWKRAVKAVFKHFRLS